MHNYLDCLSTILSPWLLELCSILGIGLYPFKFPALLYIIKRLMSEVCIIEFCVMTTFSKQSLVAALFYNHSMVKTKIRSADLTVEDGVQSKYWLIDSKSGLMLVESVVQ